MLYTGPIRSQYYSTYRILQKTSLPLKKARLRPESLASSITRLSCRADAIKSGELKDKNNINSKFHKKKSINRGTSQGQNVHIPEMLENTLVLKENERTYVVIRTK